MAQMAIFPTRLGPLGKAVKPLETGERMKVAKKAKTFLVARKLLSEVPLSPWERAAEGRERALSRRCTAPSPKGGGE
ncbi:MAG: hypothetical protein AB1405_02985 [Bdellovibrionota bacterium]